jgi:hypothetical protein
VLQVEKAVDQRGPEIVLVISEIVQRSRAASSRSTLDLLELPWPFSQVSLLTPQEFARQGEERSIGSGGARGLDVSSLQELHRTGILVPFYRVDIASGNPERVRKVADSLTVQFVRNTIPTELFRAAIDGRAADPAQEPFQPWPSERQRVTWPSVESGYLYSYHQLLGLRRARSFVTALQPRGLIGSLTWHLEDDDLPSDEDLLSLRSWRGLAIVLTALDTAYWPEIMQTISHSLETWRQVRVDFNPNAAMEWLGVSREDVAAQADQLRYDASFDDVLGDFYEIVRRANPRAWTTLRGRARTALDDRVAAEMLHRAVEDGQGPSAAPAGQPLSQQWLSDRPQSLDSALTSLHISPHPALVVGIEGETEELILPQVFDLLGIRDDPAFIRIETFGGTIKSLSLLARFASAPQLGPDRQDYVVVDRPITRFLVLTDAENRYATEADRRRERLLLLDSIARGVQDDFKADLYSREGRFVEIRTWGRYPFEFAHFTDEQLADAILASTSRQHPGGRAGLISAINRQRTLDPTPNIDDAWRQSGVGKLQLAEATWPLLERRIKRAIARGNHGPPIMAAALQAYELAMMSYQRNVVLRRRRWRPH